MSDLLTTQDIKAWLKKLPEWEQEKKAIERVFEFDDFTGAIDFVNSVAEIAEEEEHHPEIDVRYNKVIYGDCDLHFFTDPAWLWKELDTAHVLLSPHWRSSVATIDRPNFDLLYVGGLYNGGFVAASKAGVPALVAWGENCAQVL